MATIERHRDAAIVALQFLTVLPVPRVQNQDAALQGLSLLWYPAVGVLLGVLLTVLANVMPFPFYAQAVLLVGAWAALTGGLHLDGLADCADAWVGGLGDRARTLELMKDPLCGSMAVVALILVLAAKVTALAALLEAQLVGYLWLAPALARTSLLSLFLSTAYVREGGLGAVLATHFSRQWAKRLVFIAAAVICLCLGFWRGLLLLAALTIVFATVRYLTNNRIGGFTGDVAGAMVEIVEVMVLLLLLVLAGGAV